MPQEATQKKIISYLIKGHKIRTKAEIQKSICATDNQMNIALASLRRQGSVNQHRINNKTMYSIDFRQK